MFKKLFALSALMTVCATSFGAGELIVNRVVINPKGGPNVNPGPGGTTDPTCGLELIEIKNVGNAAINLGSNNVAVVVIDNERDHFGEIDTYFKLTGTLDPGEVMVIADQPGVAPATGTPSPIDGPLATDYLAADVHTRSTQWKQDGDPDGEDYELENSGASYLIVEGFNETNALNYLSSPMDSNDILKFDWVADGNASNDVWNVALGHDALTVWPEGEALGDYTIPGTSGLTFLRRLVSASTDAASAGSFTADYVFRLYRLNGTTPVYDDAIAVELDTWANPVLPIAGNLNDTSFTEFRSFSGYGRPSNGIVFRNAAGTVLTGSITGYALKAQYGNWTNNANFNHLRINGTYNYFH